MKILFAAKLIEDRNFQPLGIYHISAVLKKGGHETHIVDATSFNAVFKAVRELKPRMLAISTPTARYRFFQRLCSQLKASFPELFIVLGGVHTTMVPESISDDGIDAICRGEGEHVLLELVNRLEGGEGYTKTVGFWFKKDGDIIKNSISPLITELDLLPFADREITDVYPYCVKMPVGVFVTGRGCPFSCTFCSNSPLKNLYGDAVGYLRDYSPSRAIEEIKWAVKKYKYKRLVFMNEIFGIQKNWLVEFSNLYVKEVRLPFWCMLHPTLIDDERAEMLKYAGCRMVELGVDAGNQDIRQNILKRHITNEQILKSIQTLHKYGIRVQTSNIIGLPGSDLEKDLETLDLNIKAKVDFPDICIFQPLPRTPLADAAIRMGIFDGDFEKLPPTLNPSVKSTIKINVPHKKLVDNLGFLFPISTKSKLVRKALPLMIRLPLRPLYLLIYKAMITWFKLRYILGSPRIFSSHFIKIFWNYVRY